MRDITVTALLVTLVTLLVAASVGCSIPEKQYNPPFACYNQPLQPNASDPVTVSGTVRDPFNGAKISNASVEAVQVEPPLHIFTVTTDADGRFTRTQGTGGAPRSAYLHVTANGYLDTYYYPAVPIVDNIDVTIQLFTAMSLGTLAGAAAVNVDPTKAVLAVSVVDCNGIALGGATVTTTPTGDIRYFDSSTTPSATAKATDARTGTALVANVSPSSIMIDATVSGMTLRTHSIGAVAGAITETEIQP